MSRQNALDLLPSQFASTTHVKTLEELGYLQVESLLSALLMELGDLSLDFLHDLYLTFEKFSE